MKTLFVTKKMFFSVLPNILDEFGNLFKALRNVLLFLKFFFFLEGFLL